jgi:hypothetical protein
VAVAFSQYSKAGGALAVLGVNVAMLPLSGTATLALQRWLYRRHAPKPPPAQDDTLVRANHR